MNTTPSPVSKSAGIRFEVVAFNPKAQLLQGDPRSHLSRLERLLESGENEITLLSHGTMKTRTQYDHEPAGRIDFHR